MKKITPAWLKNIKLIAWDLDGTLYPPMPIITNQIDQARFTTMAKHLQISFNEAKTKFRSMYARLHGTARVFNELGIDGEQFFINFWKDFDLSKYIEPDPKLLKFFKQVQNRGIKHALLTNSNTNQSVQEKLTAVGLSSNLFVAIFTSSLTGIHKPMPEAFIQLWKQTSFEIDQIVYVGDKENTDIIPAKKLGLKTVKMDWLSDSETTQADLLVKTPIEFLKMFKIN